MENTVIAINRISYRITIRWRYNKEEVKPDHYCPDSYVDSDSVTTDNPLEIEKFVQSSRDEAKKRMERKAAFGATSFRIVITTIAETELI